MASDGDERDVLLHVYDLSQGIARQMSLAFIGKQIDGIWHTGVVVGNKEYFYGGGIQVERAGQTVFGAPMETIKLGTTMLPDEIIVDFLREISSKFSAETYSLFHNNCNNFSDELSTFLTGQGVPERITGLPAEFLSTPVGQMLTPILAPLEAQMKQMRGQAMFPISNTAGISVAQPSATKPQQGTNNTIEKSGPLADAADAAEQEIPPSTAPADMESLKPHTKGEFEAMVKDEFARLMSKGGLTANQAAAEAFRIVKAKTVQSQ